MMSGFEDIEIKRKLPATNGRKNSNDEVTNRTEREHHYDIVSLRKMCFMKCIEKVGRFSEGKSKPQKSVCKMFDGKSLVINLRKSFIRIVC